ncbi:MAG: TonB-dependent receptor [Candidatus Manganitrophus sp.]|nr:TonB-dependent receptor [Candidatus Manganitrophus sp.]
MFKGSRKLGDDSTLELMISYNKFAQKSEPDFEGVFEVDYTQRDFEAVHHINWGEGRLKTTWGGSYRLSVAESDEAFRSEPEQENALVRGFVQQSIALMEELTVVLAASLERSDTGGTEPAYQVATLYAPGSNHAFRASYSVAPTVPSLWEAQVDRQSDFTVIMEGNPDLEPSKLYSYEINYHGAYLDRRLQTEASLFYMKFDDLTSPFVKQQGSFFPFPTPTTYSFDNSREATAKGSELKLAYRFAPARSVYINYTYETIDDEGSTFTETDRIMIEEATPEHKVNVGGIFRIAAGFSATVNAGYKSAYAVTNARQSEIVKVHPYWRVDARLAYNPVKDVELFIAGRNLASPNHREFPDFLEIPKMDYGGVSVIY